MRDKSATIPVATLHFRVPARPASALEVRLRRKAKAAEPSAWNRALGILRGLRGWTQQQLADAAHITRQTVGDYEQGVQELSARKFWHLTEVMGHSQAKVREVLAVVQTPAPPRERWIGPVYFSPAEMLEIDALCGKASRLADSSFRQMISQARVLEAAAEARAEARDLWFALCVERRLRAAVREHPEYQTWALSELLCEESIRAASNKPDRALELAEAAVVAAELAPGTKKWRLRVQGQAHAHVGNAWRVIEAWEKAERAFRRYRECWELGKNGDPLHLLNEGRVFGLEASLRREQHRIAEALDLLHQGLAVSNNDERGFLLINQAKTLETAEDFEGAIAVLRGAMPQISRLNLRLMFVVRFDLAVNLCHLRRFSEVATFLPELQKFSAQLCQPLEKLRVRWLEGWVTAGLGQLGKGVEILSSVKEEFVERGLVYDAALVTMELADSLLQLKRLAHVKALAKQMTPIFCERGIHDKALKALLLFRKAAEEEVVTVELVRSIRVFLRRAHPKYDLEFTL